MTTNGTQETQKLHLEILQKRDEFDESYKKIDSEIKSFENGGKEWMGETVDELELSLIELEELCKNKFEEENKVTSLKERFEFTKNKLIDWILENEEILEYLSSELSANVEEALLSEIQEKVAYFITVH